MVVHPFMHSAGLLCLFHHRLCAWAAPGPALTLSPTSSPTPSPSPPSPASPAASGPPAFSSETWDQSSRKTSTSALLTVPKPLPVWITINWKFFKEMGLSDYLIFLLRNLYQVKKQQLKPDMEQWTGSKLRKEYIKAVYCQLAYLISMQRTSCEMPGWMKHNLESRLTGRNINNLIYADDTTLMAERELKKL